MHIYKEGGKVKPRKVASFAEKMRSELKLLTKHCIAGRTQRRDAGRQSSNFAPFHFPILSSTDWPRDGPSGSF